MSKNKLRVGLAAFGVLTLLFLYGHHFSIEDNETSIISELETQAGEMTKKEVGSLELLSWDSPGRDTFILFAAAGTEHSLYGFAMLQKGLNGNHRLRYVGLCENDLQPLSSVVMHLPGYNVHMGKSRGAETVVEDYGKNCVLEIATYNRDHYMKVVPDPDSYMPHYEDTRFYDRNGRLMEIAKGPEQYNNRISHMTKQVSGRYTVLLEILLAAVLWAILIILLPRRLCS